MPQETNQITVLQSLIDTLRTETRTSSVSPARLAAIHQRLLDLLRSIDTGKFLRKDTDDTTTHRLTAGTFTARDLLTIGTYIQGLLGAGIDAQGNGEFESLKIRSYLEVAELIFNRQETIESDKIFTEGDLIESVEPWPDGVTYTLHIHPRWEGYTTAMTQHDVCRGIYNNIRPQAPAGDAQTSIHGAVSYTSFFRVISVNQAANTLDVIIYPDAEVPAGRNFAPQPMMAFSRWGWAGSADDTTHAHRQTLFYLSSTQGSLVKLSGVTKPIIDISNIELVLGTLPAELTALDPRLGPGAHGAYIKNLLAQNIIQFDHLGHPKPVIEFVGEYDPLRRYLAGDTPDPDLAGQYTRHAVLYYGCQWLCCVTGTPDPPSWKSTAWTFYLGDPTFSIKLLGGPDAVNPRRFSFTLQIKATKSNQDCTADLLPQDILWTRYTEDADGNPRIASDQIWNLKRGASGLSLPLTQDDIDGIPTVPHVCIFTATATLRDGTDLSASQTIN